MRSTLRFVLTLAVFAPTTAALAFAQDHSPQHRDAAPKAEERAGDPYPFDTCPISGEKLDSMESVTRVFDGREVRFCCSDCVEMFQKDRSAALARLDEMISKDQAPLYPLKTSVVTGAPLPEKPFEFVYGNRLIRLGAASERKDFDKAPKRYLAKLNDSVVAAQLPTDHATTCPVSGEKLGGEMGEPVNMVIAGRLIRLCCSGCRKDVEKDPAKFIGMADRARHPDQSASGDSAESRTNADHHNSDHEHTHGGAHEKDREESPHHSH